VAKEQPEVVFLGTSAPDSAVNRLKASNVRYKRKRLDSGVENWRTIVEILREPQVRCVVAKLTSQNYATLVHPEYAEVSESLLQAIAAVPHILFVHESILTGEQLPPSPPQRERFVVDGPDGPVELEIEDEAEEWWFFIRSSYMTPPDEAVRRQIEARLEVHSLVPTPYRTNAELDVLAGSFVEDSQRDLLFRVYIPGGRLYAAEADALMRMFRDWLTQVGRHSVRQDGYRTPAGQVFEFFGDGSLTALDLPSKVDQFTAFLASCVDDPREAVLSLTQLGLAPSAGEQLVARFAKEARRLHIDVRHAREQRIMALRHAFESEMVDLLDPGRSANAIEAQLEQWLPGQVEVRSILPAFSAPASTVVVNIGQQIVGGVHDSVMQNLQGTMHFGPEASEILRLIRAHGGADQAELSSDLHELEDPDARTEDRMSARQRLKGFLIRISRGAETAGIEILKKYVERKLGLP
jgi:hypothetical protein